MVSGYFEAKESILVEAVTSTGRRISYFAAQFRNDLHAIGLGTGHHGFEFDVKDLQIQPEETFDVRAIGSLRPLNTRPLTLDPLLELLSGTLPEEVSRAFAELALEVRTRHPH